MLLVCKKSKTHTCGQYYEVKKTKNTFWYYDFLEIPKNMCQGHNLWKVD